MPRDFLPPLRFQWLSRYYDPLMDRLFRDRRRKARFVAALGVGRGTRLLDVGCGTARLAAALAVDCRQPRLVGIDRDLESVLIAAARLRRLSLNGGLVVGDAASLPFASGSFDCVTSTLVFHHLSTPKKRIALRETLRALRARGRFLLLDFARPSGTLRRLAFLGVRLFDGWRETAANASGEVPVLMIKEGFRGIREEYLDDTPFGTLRCYSATSQESGPSPAVGPYEGSQNVSVTPK